MLAAQSFQRKGERMSAESAVAGRIQSLDQFRGYTVAGMFLVNFLGSFAACPVILKHHNTYCSYADTIMPQFLFAVGFAFRLTFRRRVERDGWQAAYSRVARRLLGLALFSIVFYSASRRADTWEQLVQMGFWGALAEPLKRTWFQTLMHIAVTSLWVLPVINAGAGIRMMYMLASAALHVAMSYWFNFEWTFTAPNAIDGGPLGFLTWTVPCLTGTLACDMVVKRPGSGAVGIMLVWSALLMSAGYGMSCLTRAYDVPPEQQESLKDQKLATSPVLPPSDRFQSAPVERWLAEPPFVPPPEPQYRKLNYWMMSQRAGTLSYLTFAAGFSLAVYAFFYAACDIFTWQSTFFRVFGMNAFAGYVLHEIVGLGVKPFIPRDAPGWYVTCGLLLFFGIIYVFTRHLDKSGIYLRI